MKRPIFVAGGGTQWEDALRIASALDGRAWVLHLGTLELLDPPPPGTPYDGVHWPEQGMRATDRLRRLLGRVLSGATAVVLGQDAGRPQRLVARTARARGLPVVVVPDGALFHGRATLAPRDRAQEITLRAIGWTAGRPLEFGSTQPDLWCAWGAGWVPMLERFSPHGRVVVTGSPRSSSLDRLAPARPHDRRVLICSQPTSVHPFPSSATAEPRWYRWIERVVESAPIDRVSVRLHPRERDTVDRLGLGPATQAVVSVGRTLADDLARADAVVAPFSTVLLEAGAAGRPVISVVPEPAAREVRWLSPAMADERLRVVVADDIPDFAALDDALNVDVAGWAHDYCVVAPDAAERCAVAVSELGAGVSVR